MNKIVRTPSALSSAMLVAFQWLTILLVWHFRIWSTGELAARNPEYTSCNMVQVSQKAPQPQPVVGLSSRGKKILNFEIVGCYFGTQEKSQSQLAPPLSSWGVQGWYNIPSVHFFQITLSYSFKGCVYFILFSIFLFTFSLRYSCLITLCKFIT